VKARFTVGDVLYPLVQITVDDMAVILKDERLKDVLGIPNYFDELGRVWPKPPLDKAVEFYDK